jgi:hypothetical protein
LQPQVSISRSSAEIAVRAIRWLEPADRSWAMMPNEDRSRTIYEALVAARQELEEAIREAP